MQGGGCSFIECGIICGGCVCVCLGGEGGGGDRRLLVYNGREWSVLIVPYMVESEKIRTVLAVKQ